MLKQNHLQAPLPLQKEHFTSKEVVTDLYFIIQQRLLQNLSVPLQKGQFTLSNPSYFDAASSSG
jgi:hypothetical protein